MARSPETMPPGWGFGKPRETKVQLRPIASRGDDPKPPRTRATRQRGSDDRRLHMRFALWALFTEASRIGPLHPKDVTDQFGVSYETARRWLVEWKKVNEEMHA